MSVNPYLNFAGNCRQAVEYYAEVFGSKPVMQTFSEMPPPPDPNMRVPEEAKNWILHAELTVSGTQIMFSDTFPGMPLNVGNNVSLTVVTKDRNEILSAWNKLREGGTVGMDLQETFWSKLYGTITDKFGTIWQFSLDSGETFG